MKKMDMYGITGKEIKERHFKIRVFMCCKCSKWFKKPIKRKKEQNCNIKISSLNCKWISYQQKLRLADFWNNIIKTLREKNKTVTLKLYIN